jgi:hypothetical protein
VKHQRRPARADHEQHAHIDQVRVELVGSSDRTELAVTLTVPTGRLIMLPEEARDLARTLLDAVHDAGRVRSGQPVPGFDPAPRQARPS